MVAGIAEAAPLFMVAPGAAAVPRATAAVAPQAAVALAKPAVATLNAATPQLGFAQALPVVQIPRSSVPDVNLVAVATALAGAAAAAPQLALPASSSVAVGSSLLSPGPTLAVVASVGLIAAWRQFAGSQLQEGAAVAQAVVPAAAGAVQATTSAASVATSAGAVVALPLGGSLAGKFLRTRSSAIKMAATPSESDFCYGLPGAIGPFGDFDPANMLEGTPKEEVMRWREAELTHGRVGMLAAAGFLVQENFHPLFTADGGPAIEQIPKLPPLIWFIMIVGIAIAENKRILKGWADPFEGKKNVQRLNPDYTPGDLGFDPLGLKPESPAEFRTMQEKELSNGRLGMIAAAGFMAQEAATGTTWGQTLFGQ